MKPGTRKGGPALPRRAGGEAALASADAAGLATVTFRRLAAGFGVTPMSLYRYVDSKQALLDAIADRVFEDFELSADDGADWREQLRDLAYSYRRLLLAHPAIAALRSAATPPPSLNHARA